MATKEAAVLDADFEVEGPTSTAVATRSAVGIVARGTPGAGGLIRPVASPAEVLSVQNETRALVRQALEEGRDYGKIPGTAKNSLWKAGAERTNAAFAVYPEFEVLEKEVDHDRVVPWTKKGRGGSTYSGTSQGLYRYVLKCYLIHRESGAIIGTGVGSCSTLESKYIDRPRDLENTVFKMAKKRAYVDATLTAYGLSDEFTQDVEDMPREVFQREEEDDGEPKPVCPECSGPMWDNREGKKNPNAPDFKCRDKKCSGVLWPGQWPPAELDELITKVRTMVADIFALDAAQGKSAEEFAEAVLGKEGLTEEQVKKLGSQLLPRLKKLQEGAKARTTETPAQAAPEPNADADTSDPFPDELPF